MGSVRDHATKGGKGRDSSLTGGMTTEEKALADSFKDNPKKALKRLMAEGALKDDPEAVSKFLLHSDGLDDAAIGDYVGDGDPFCKKVLTCYVGTFNLVGLGFDDALRKFLSAFRLPGEAQKIERIMDSFSSQ